MIGNLGAAVYEGSIPPSPSSGDSVVSTPPREGRSTDASRLMFPLPVVAAIVGTAITVVGGQYIANSGLRDQQREIQSDIRDMRTRMEMQTQIDVARQESRLSEMKSQNDAIGELRRLTQLLQLQYAEISKQIQKR